MNETFTLLSVSDRDLIVRAQSGTGKTATYAIAALQQLDVQNPECQALILVPTRELAQQVKTVTVHMAKAHIF